MKHCKNGGQNSKRNEDCHPDVEWKHFDQVVYGGQRNWCPGGIFHIKLVIKVAKAKEGIIWLDDPTSTKYKVNFSVLNLQILLLNAPRP